MNVGVGRGQADRLGIGNEMNFVAALGQFQPQFGCNHPTAAISRIAGDADLHARPSHLSLHIRWRAIMSDSDFAAKRMTFAHLGQSPVCVSNSRMCPFTSFPRLKTLTYRRAY